MEKLMKIKRSIEYANYEYKFELIKAGIFHDLNQEIDKFIKNDQRVKVGQVGIIEDIINLLIQDNHKISPLIVQETNFIEYEMLSFIYRRQNQIIYEVKVKILEIFFTDPQTIDKLMKIKRLIEYIHDQQPKMELINTGIVNLLDKEIDSALKKDEKQRDDEIEIIEDIFNLLLKENHETSQMIVDQKDFIEHQLIIFNSLPLNKIKSIYLYPLESLSKQDHKELNNKLFEMGIIQLLVNILESKDKNVKEKAIQIIFDIIKSELKELKEGQKHPYHTQLSSDGVINKLIQMQHDKDKVDINYYIAQVIAYLFKAAALPPVNGKSIIDLLKVYRIKDLTFLAECKDNHDDILADDFEHQLFKDDGIIEQFTQLTLLFMKYGSVLNKMKVAFTVKDYVKKLTDNKYLQEIAYESNLYFEQMQNIMRDATEIISFINDIIGKVNMDQIQQLMKIVNSDDDQMKTKTIQVISYIIKDADEKLKVGEQNPYFQQFTEDGTMIKLIDLFQDKNQENIHLFIAEIFTYLFKTEAFPTEIRNKAIQLLIQNMKFDLLNILAMSSENQNELFAHITRDLQLLIEVSEEEKPQIKKMQEIEFKFLNEFLQNNEDDEMHKTIINSGIADALLSIFSTRDLDEITYTPFQTFFFFTWPYSAEISKLLIDKNPFPSLLRLFDHKDLDIINESINAMVNIMFGGTIGLDETSVHPYYEDLVQAGGIEKIYSLFKRNVSRQSQNSAAICLGIAFKSRIITDENMKLEIITHLKSISNQYDDEVVLALKCLNQNSDNHEIEKDDFAIRD